MLEVPQIIISIHIFSKNHIIVDRVQGVLSRRARPSGKGRAARLDSASHGGGRADEWPTATDRHASLLPRPANTSGISAPQRIPIFTIIQSTEGNITYGFRCLHRLLVIIGLFRPQVPALQMRVLAEKRQILFLWMFSVFNNILPSIDIFVWLVPTFRENRLPPSSRIISRCLQGHGTGWGNLNALDSQSGGARFESTPGYLLSWLFFVFFLIPSWQMPG
jgi:hypothetical protein